MSTEEELLKYFRDFLVENDNVHQFLYVLHICFGKAVGSPAVQTDENNMFSFIFSFGMAGESETEEECECSK